MTRLARSLTSLAIAAGAWLIDAWPAAPAVFAAHAACTVSTTPVSLGTYNPSAPTPLDGEGTISWRCTGNRRTVQITISTGSSGSFSRRMTGPSGSLQYNLYIDATRQTIWGDGTAGTQSVFQDTRANEAYVVSVYGRVPSAQSVQAGTYTDMLVVTVLE